ncbi:MAG: hypothetical protein U9R74_18240 [Pseudomonadota bacterium]|nr:hypothetical protein [Pseudomonadota bacterium]
MERAVRERDVVVGRVRGGKHSPPLIELAGPGDDADLRRLLRESPMPGWISVSLEREPDYFGAGAIEGDVSQTLVARDTREGRVIGMGTRSVRDVFLNGRVDRMGYFGQLRVDSRYRGSRRRLQEAYRAWKPIHDSGDAAFYLTSIVEGNTRARRLLTLGVPGLPTYREFASFSTLALPCSRRWWRRRRPGVTRAVPADLGAIARFLQGNYAQYQCAPCWTETALRSRETCRELGAEDFFLAANDGRIEGCLAIWDQRRFRQSVVRGYADSLKRWRPGINRVSTLLRIPVLPPPGVALNQAFLSHIAATRQKPELLPGLIRAAMDEAYARRIDWLILGFSEENPLRSLVKRHFTHLEYRSVLYLVYWPDGEEAARALDSRVVHVEVATL